MADLKISQLTSATTPLAGTEVLPIVQSTATKQVSVANLTAGRAISATQLTLTTGNLIVASGQGVDFSATPNTGTSELFDDYEEGTWTAIYTADTPPTTPFTMANISATYTKIGRLVTVRAYMQTNNVNTTGAAGGVRIAGLPYASATDEWSVLTIGLASSFAVNYPLYGLVRAGTSEVTMLYKATSFGTNTSLALTDLVTGASAGQNQLVVFGQYYAAT